MLDHVIYGTSSLLKRSFEDPIAKWVWPMFSLEFLVFLPIIVFLAYTLGTLFPALAIVEDDNPPLTYQPLSLDIDAENTEEGGQARSQPEDGLPITSSLRRVHALLKSLSGWRSLFRGLVPLVAAQLATSTLRGIIAAPLYSLYLDRLASIPAHLALVQLHTVWLHVVITPPNPLPFWKRLPPFKKTFSATVLPFVLFAVAREVAVGIPALVFFFATRGPANDTSPFFMPLLILGLAALLFVLWFTLVLPAHIALIRIQASLLPPDEDPIVPFDRSFGGRVNPLISVGGEAGEGEKTHATLRDIWETLSRAAIWRVARMVLKATGIHVATAVVLGGLAFGTMLLGNVHINWGSGDGHQRDWW